MNKTSGLGMAVNVVLRNVQLFVVALVAAAPASIIIDVFAV